MYDKVNKEWSGPKVPTVLNPEANIGQVVLYSLSRTPDTIAQICVDGEGEELKCGELQLRTIRVAQNLTRMGYKKGDVICSALQNHSNTTALALGAVCLGLQVSGLDPDFKEDYIEHMLGVTKPILIFCEQENLEVIKSAVKKIGISPKLTVYGPARDDVPSVHDFLRKTGEEHLYNAPYLGDSKNLISFICCTSGTTGYPKALCFSHAQMIAMQSFPNTRNARCLYFSTIGWASGVITMIKCILNGFTRVTMTKRYTTDIAIDIIEKFKITDMMLTGNYCAQFARYSRLKTTDLSTLQFLCLTGISVPDKFRDDIERYLPKIKVIYVYGMSETCGVIAINFPEKRIGSSGKVAPNFIVKIVGENGESLGPNERGEIYVQHHIPFMGYYNNPESTKACLEDGWFKTGDFGYLDEDSFMYVLDRKYNTFKSKGHFIYPSEIEEIINRHDDVINSCVSYKYDAKSDQNLPVAVIVKKLGSKLMEVDFLKHSNENIKFDYQKLHRVFFINELPETISAKIQRSFVKEYVKNLK